jgi:hypothetical protein
MNESINIMTAPVLVPQITHMEFAGEVDVQSGQVMIADPCLVVGMETYDKLVNRRNSIGLPSIVNIGKRKIGLIADTHQDRKHPIYVEKDTEGVVVGLYIKMDSAA